MLDRIVIRGAREHNLKNIDIEVPRGQITVVTGVSGSGKSTLAFDTLYAEGQRRYIESLSTYAKQFLERIGRPDVDEVSGISPSIAIQQKNTTRSSRSTVGTATEIYDYLRLLFARVGHTWCPNCKIPLVRSAPDEVIERLLAGHVGETFLVVAPMLIEKGTGKKRLEQLLADGFTRILVGGEVKRLGEAPMRGAARWKQIEVVLDRIEVDADRRARLLDAIETAYRIAPDLVRFDPVVGKGDSLTFTPQPLCLECGRSFEEPRPILFSFNTPYGACPHCRGFGNRMEFDQALIVPKSARSIRQKAIEPWSSEKFEHYYDQLIRYCRRKRISIEKPYHRLSARARNAIMNGDGHYVGVLPFLESLREKTYKKYARFFTRRYLAYRPCTRCEGGRLRAEAYYVLLGGKTIRHVNRMTPGDALSFVRSLKLSAKDKVVAKDVLLEITSRLQFMLDVGLYYLTLDRLTKTLSGGEAQRISLANSLGSNLLDVLYVLDEPSIGLHPRDTDNLVKVLTQLRERGNTVVVVEHDVDIIRQADHIIDLGPGAGVNGGSVLYQGPIDGKSKNAKASKTLKYVNDGIPISKRTNNRPRSTQAIKLIGVSEHNLQKITVEFPLGAFTCVTGVSGSGKSTLACEVLYNALSHAGEYHTHAFERVEGRELINKVMMVDQSPVGKTPRSNPITYIKAFAHIREVFASQRLARKRGYKSGRFSFNVAGGRCGRCQGMGYERVEMHFMADLFVCCPDCDGKRFNQETLEVTYRGRNLAEVLEFTVEDAAVFFADHKQLVKQLKVLQKVGLGYLCLGQPSTTLSGGESQRMKIARELAENDEGNSLYILDEPTTGLHVEDVSTLIAVLRELMENGNTIVVVEHNPQVILESDHIIDLGPGGGDDGGHVVSVGTPAQVSRARGSHTGSFLRKFVRANSSAGQKGQS